MISPPPAALNVEPANAIYADGLLREAVGVAREQVWHLTADDVTIYVYTPAADDPAVARGSQGEVYFNRVFRDGWWRNYTDTGAPISVRRGALEEACTVAAHELGHALLGLGHTPGTLMAPEAPNLPEDRHTADPDVAVEPVACARWARLKLVDRHAKVARESRAARASVSTAARRARYAPRLGRQALGQL